MTPTRQIVILDMNVTGKVSERKVVPGSEMWLDNTVAGRLYPNLKLALVSVPTEILELDETSKVLNSLLNVVWGGVAYKLVGSGGGAKNGKFYFADEEHALLLQARFQKWPEALISYFGIQTSDCKRIVNADGTVLVVPDNELGTNDCRGWISESMFALLDAPQRAFYQFRLGFALENGKGSFKVMSDDVAKAVGADIIIPESSCKPAPRNLKPWSYERRADRMFAGPLVVGLREVSRNLVFGSSYTVAQFASEEVILTEIVPKAREALQSLKDAWDAGNHLAVVEQIGKKVSLDQFANESNEEDEDVLRTVEATLIADGSGEILRHPYVHKQVDKLLARWAYKLLTGGGLHLPGFALADDGYLFVNNDGVVVSGSDWLPKEYALTDLASERSLCVRYPVRMKEDLLPMKHCHRDQAIALLTERGLSEQEAFSVADEQLFLRGTYTLHSKTAKKNGGDYDFDQICVVDAARYPKFVEDCFTFVSPYKAVEKNKVERLKSPIYSLETIAMKAMGNEIGVITDTMSSCIAAGNTDKMYVLVEELQKEIDSLKHNIRADKSVIKEIKELVGKPIWLGLKDVQKVSELIGTAQLDVLPTDKIGKMFNLLRHDLCEMMAKPMEIRQFQGLIVGNLPTKEMLEEAQFAYRAFVAAFVMIGQKTAEQSKAVEAAVSAFNSAKESGVQESIKEARKALSKARAELTRAQELSKESSSRLIKIIAGWGRGKQENRAAWAQALHTVICNGRGIGSMLFHAFPQEAINAIAKRTGGVRSKVAVNKVAGIVTIKDNVFYQAKFDGTQSEALFGFDAKKQRLFTPNNVTA